MGKKMADGQAARTAGKLIAVSLIGLLHACAGENNQKPADAPIEHLSIEDIYVAYRDNPVAAELRFDKVRLQVTGKVDSVELDTAGRPELYLWAPHGGVASVEFDRDNADRIAVLKKGDVVRLVCQDVRKMTTDWVFVLNGCRI